VEGAEERLLGTAVHLVNFTFVAKKAAAVSEALKFLATLDVTLIRSVMFVHVFAPFAFSVERCTPAFLILAYHLAVFIARRFFGAFVAVVLP
jgi:hypothetical protein